MVLLRSVICDAAPNIPWPLEVCGASMFVKSQLFKSEPLPTEKSNWSTLNVQVHVFETVTVTLWCEKAQLSFSWMVGTLDKQCLFFHCILADEQTMSSCDEDITSSSLWKETRKLSCSMESFYGCLIHALTGGPGCFKQEERHRDSGMRLKSNLNEL